MIWRAFYLVLCGVFLAGIIHIAIILLIPFVGSRDAAKQILTSGQMLNFEAIGENEKLKLAANDPYFKTSVCRFDLTQDGVQITGQQIPDFWSASVFDDRGRIVYSMNDRTAIKNRLQMVVVSPVQMADIRQAQPEEIETSIIVETTANKGFVILRALVRDQSLQEQAKAFLDTAECKAYLTR